jgi:hypothetical protein
MGDRIHEQRSMEPPRCSGRRKKPCHGFYTTIGKSDKKVVEKCVVRREHTMI